MARKRYGDEEILNLLHQIELSLDSACDVATACRSAGVSDATYYNWRKKYGGMGKSQLREMKELENGGRPFAKRTQLTTNAQLKKIVAELELDKLILKESLDFLKPKV